MNKDTQVSAATLHIAGYVAVRTKAWNWLMLRRYALWDLPRRLCTTRVFLSVNSLRWPRHFAFVEALSARIVAAVGALSAIELLTVAFMILIRVSIQIVVFSLEPIYLEGTQYNNLDFSFVLLSRVEGNISICRVPLLLSSPEIIYLEDTLHTRLERLWTPIGDLFLARHLLLALSTTHFLLHGWMVVKSWWKAIQSQVSGLSLLNISF